MVKKLVLLMTLAVFGLTVAAIPSFAAVLSKTGADSSAAAPCPGMNDMAKQMGGNDCCKNNFECFKQCFSSVALLKHFSLSAPPLGAMIMAGAAYDLPPIDPARLLRPPKA